MTAVDTAPSETALEAGGHAKGVAVAVVKENKDDSGLGRVKVSFPWHSQPRASYWARVAMPMAGKERGMYFIPEVGDEVLVAFDRGDLRFPYVLGSLWNGVDKAAVNNADGKNDVRQIRTRKGHKLTFNDGSKGQVQLELNDGKKLVIDDDGITLNDDKGNTIAIKSLSGEMTLEAKTKLTLKAPSIAIDASTTVTMSGSASATLKGGQVFIN